jgi:hypothetical protein
MVTPRFLKAPCLLDGFEPVKFLFSFNSQYYKNRRGSNMKRGLNKGDSNLSTKCPIAHYNTDGSIL